MTLFEDLVSFFFFFKGSVRVLGSVWKNLFCSLEMVWILEVFLFFQGVVVKAVLFEVFFPTQS